MIVTFVFYIFMLIGVSDSVSKLLFTDYEQRQFFYKAKIRSNSNVKSNLVLTLRNQSHFRT